MNKPIFLLLFWCIFCCCACSSHKRLSGTSSRPGELSHRLSIKVNRHDDLRLFSEAADWLGTPYRYGGTTRKGVDCSGLVGNIYKKVYHRTLSRTVNGIADSDCRKISKNDLKSGDLIFFNTSKKKRGINHIGLFLKQGYFIHASSTKGVIISNLRDDYYRKTYKRAGRVKR